MTTMSMPATRNSSGTPSISALAAAASKIIPAISSNPASVTMPEGFGLAETG
jgi:hypothetical protein